ncbi:MAG: glutamate--tRNA ligase, partial [Epsilonproteobacteria bacterium]|nr:glutamate--tRNA ligase [Campylobacterota bacterium]
MLRFAPSSTGDIYINDLRIALFNYIISKQKKEDFLISIEETDKNILELLAIFDIEYSQVIYNGQNMRFHSAMALQLLHEKKAFSCFCSSEYLDKKQQEAKNMNKKYTYDDACRNLPAELVIDNTNPFTIRINKPDDNKSKLDAVDSFIILNQDKKPTQNFAIAVDDMLNDISLVVDEQEDTNNTLKQEYIRTSLGYGKKIKYIHIPPLLNEDKNNFSIKWLLSEGYLPAAISNYLISINNNNLPSDIFTLQDAIKWFKIDDISHSPALFSLELLRDINKIHLENLDAVELSRYVGFADANIGELAKVYL